MIGTEQVTFTEALGLRGWESLEPALLAALATESPLLLVGAHGTGKSQLIERVARALALSFRHYNASLLNYDDLVGIPMPSADGTRLDFIKSDGTIWGAGFVFLDEISRCRADLQSKLFPLVHERRVVGIALEDLRHRWAAMNPPAPEELTNAAKTYYLGSEPLDPALSDRFPYILMVPTWAQLSKAERRQVIDDEDVQIEDLPDLLELVNSCADLIPVVDAEFRAWLSDYIVWVVDLLEQQGLPQSPRRARMLAKAVVAIHAARLVLEGDAADAEYSAQLALQYGLPQTATDTPPSLVKLVAIHKQAWELTQHMDDDNWRAVLEEMHPARRIALADELNFTDEELSRLVTHTLSTEDSDIRQIGLAVGCFVRFSSTRNLDPSAFEPLAQLSSHLLEPRVLRYNLNTNGPESAMWDEIVHWIESQKDRVQSPLYRLQRNFLLYGFPDFWRRENWVEALKQFTEDLQTLGVTDKS